MIFSVSDASALIKGVMEQTFNRIKIRGELSQITRASSGHTYMTIKDSNAAISAIIWKGTRIPFNLTEGTEIIATGKITTYPARSNYQIIVSEIELAGIGAILKMLEERKQKFAAMEFFDESQKKAIPKYPEKIGVITSPTGAAIHDIINRLRDRFPVNLILWPATVQGETAESEVANAIIGFNKLSDKNRPDVIIVARGGGSIEDLLPFSGEKIIYAVHDSKIPIISGVGHDPDWTLIDFVSDLRAPTPTGAAESVVPDKLNLKQVINTFNQRINSAIINNIKNNREKLNLISLKNPIQIIAEKYQRLDDYIRNLNSLMKLKIEQSKNKIPDIQNLNLRIKNIFENTNQKLKSLSSLLESYSFKKTLSRGFSIIKNNNNEIITSVKKLASESDATAQFYDGEIKINIKN